MDKTAGDTGASPIGPLTAQPNQQSAYEYPDGHPQRWPILAVLVVSLLVVVLDNTVLNIALKTIQQELGATQEQLLWAINSYTLVFAALLFSWGVLGDRYGRRRILMIGLFLFGIASAGTAWAQSPDQLILLRALMGIGGAAVMPVTLAIITVVFPARERGRAIGLWAAAVGAAVAIGPVVGGLLLDNFWWGSVFLINVPIVIAGLIGIALLVPESKNPLPKRLDPIGVVWSIGALLLLVYGIIHGGDTRQWTSASVLGSIAAGIILLAAFVVYEMRSDHPSLDVTLFRNRGFSVSLTAVSLAFFALTGATFFLAFYLQYVRGFSPLRAGLCFVPFAAGQLLGAPRSAAMVQRFGARLVISLGLLLVAVTFACFLFLDVTTGVWVILVLFVAFGFGMGNTIAPSTTQMTLALPPHQVGAGSAVQNTVRQVWGALGVAILGSVLATAYSRQMDTHVAGLPGAAASAASDSIGGAVYVAGQIGSSNAPNAGQLAGTLLSAGNNAFIHAMHVTAVFSCLTLLVAAAIVALFLPQSRGTESTYAGAVPDGSARPSPQARPAASAE